MPKKLFEKVRLRCGIELKNRVALAPLTNGQSHADGRLSDEEYNWLRLRAEGGFGLLISCAAYVAENGKAWHGELGVANDSHLNGLKRLSEMYKKNNTHGLIQLFHGGFRANSKITGQQTISASHLTLDWPGVEPCRGATEVEITAAIGAFEKGAQLVAAADLAGAEIHGANGYLLTQFLSSFTNHRTDKWGGSLENRARILYEVITRARKALGPNRILGVRLSPEDTRMISGLDIDESIQVMKHLWELGSDYIHLSLAQFNKKTTKYGDGGEVLATYVRSKIPKECPLIISGNIWTLEDATSALEVGADFLAIGSGAIANPSWPKKAEHALRESQPFKPDRLPLTSSELSERAVSPAFQEYLKPRGYVKA